MESEWKNVQIYFDKDGKLIGTPIMYLEKVHLDVEMEYTEELTPPYDDEELYNFIVRLVAISGTDQEMNKVESYKEFNVLYKGKLGIEKHMRRSWTSATKKLALIHITYQKGNGYEVIPTKKNFKMKGAFDYDKTHAIRIETSDAPEKLAPAFLELMEYVMQNDLLQRPVETKKP